MVGSDNGSLTKLEKAKTVMDTDASPSFGLNKQLTVL